MDILLNTLIAFYVLEILLILLTKETFTFEIFIPFVNVLATVFLIILFFDMLKDRLRKRSKDDYKIKTYKGYYYVVHYNNPICFRKDLNIEMNKGFWIPFKGDKLICFELKEDAIKFIDYFESIEILDRLS